MSRSVLERPVRELELSGDAREEILPLSSFICGVPLKTTPENPKKSIDKLHNFSGTYWPSFVDTSVFLSIRSGQSTFELILLEQNPTYGTPVSFNFGREGCDDKKNALTRAKRRLLRVP